jgi:MerR family transcriptional regulator, redox-sensitive transcriptional activator SoxR
MLTIGEVASRAGLRTSAIRYYERKGLLPAPKRVSGQRRYDETILQTLNVIQLAQAAGFTIAEIQKLLNAFPTDIPASIRWQAIASAKLAEAEVLIERANAMKATLHYLLKCTCDDIIACGNSTNHL